MTRVLIGWSAWLLASYLLVACDESAQGGDTQTNWLKTCQASAECGDLECICGRCTKTCEASECGDVAAEAVCFPPTNQAVQSLCEGSAPSAVCLGGCETAAQCGRNQQCLAGACVPSTLAPVGTADDPAGFCQLWIDSFATYVEGCGCGAEASSRYREQAASLCAADGVFGGLSAAVELGALRYDAAAASALFARLQADDPLCVEEPLRNLGLDSLEVYSLAGTFNGTRALGEACSSPVSFKGGINDCSEGVCAPDTASVGVCIALVEVGEACDASGDESLLASTPRLCHDTRPPDSDGEYASAFDAVSCLEGTCTQVLDDGQPCESDELCNSGRCGGTDPEPRTCQPKAAAGEACARSRDCLAGGCRYDLTPSVCGELLADGLACSYDDESCASGYCGGDSQGGVCGPAPTAPIGSACTTDTECISGVCRGGRCFADICGDYLD
jgi:hypothetical protein